MVDEIGMKKIDGTIVTVPEGSRAFLITDGKILEISEIGKVFTAAEATAQSPSLSVSVTKTPYQPPVIGPEYPTTAKEPEYPTIAKEYAELPTVSKEVRVVEVPRITPPEEMHLLPTPTEVQKSIKEFDEFVGRYKLTPEQKEELKKAAHIAKEDIKRAASLTRKELKKAEEGARKFVHFLSEHLKRKGEKKLKEEVV